MYLVFGFGFQFLGRQLRARLRGPRLVIPPPPTSPPPLLLQDVQVYTSGKEIMSNAARSEYFRSLFLAYQIKVLLHYSDPVGMNIP